MKKGIFIKNFLNAFISVIPVFLVVEILNIFKIVPILSFEGNILFFISFLLLVVGITFFSIGVDQSINKIGQYISSSLMEKKSIFLFSLICFLIGLFATIAEPDLIVMAEQLSIKKIYLFIFLVGIGVGTFLVIGVLRVIFKQNLKLWLLFFYGLIFTIINLVDKSFIPVIFDSSGMTTGTITVPFILSIGLGISKSRGDGSNNDSFGLSSFCSLGPLFILTFFAKFINFSEQISSDTISNNNAILLDIISKMKIVFKNVLFSILPIIILFFVYDFFFLKLPKKNILKISIGIIYVYFGLTLFLTGVDISFTQIAKKFGYLLALKNKIWLFIVSGIIGFVTTLCEPGVKVLINQIENVSNGSIKKINILLVLSLSISLAVIMSVIRIIFDFSILYYIIPGYIFAILLSFFTQNIYFGIAFDSGGVASGSLSSAFILPFIIGIAKYFCSLRSLGSEMTKKFILTNGFGVISMIALMPLIVIQIFGLCVYIINNYNNIIRRKKICEGEDNQIIHFYE